MDSLGFIKKRAFKYDLIAENVNDSTLKIHSKKFNFDSWLVIDCESHLELWHMNKLGTNKCTYHLQTNIPKKLSIRVLERINKHNTYVAFSKGYNKTNLVDIVLKKDMRRNKKIQQ